MKETFEVYLFDEVFYTKEELEVMGLKICNEVELVKILSGKNKDYPISSYSCHGEGTTILNSSLSVLEATCNEAKICAFKDFGTYGKGLDLIRFYGIQYNGVSFITLDSEKRDECYSMIKEIFADKEYDKYDLYLDYDVKCIINKFRSEKEDSYQSAFDIQDKINQNRKKNNKDYSLNYGISFFLIHIFK